MAGFSLKKLLSRSRFIVDFKGEHKDVDNNWWRVEGVGMEVSPVKTTHSQSIYGEVGPGDQVYMDVTISGPMTAGRKVVTEFLNSWIEMRNGNCGDRLNVSITYESPSGGERRTIDFEDVIPIRYDAPALGGKGTAMESLTFRAFRMKFQ